MPSMTFQLRKLLLLVALPVSMTLQSRGQGTFQNLDFESATIVPAPTHPSISNFGRKVRASGLRLGIPGIRTSFKPSVIRL